jgi:hypothetical protein
MADDQDVPDLNVLVTQFAEALYDPDKLSRVQRTIRNGMAEGGTVVTAVLWAAFDGLLEKLGQAFNLIEEKTETVAGPALARIVAHLLGQEVSITDLRRSAAGAEGAVVGGLVADIALRALSVDAQEIAPGDDGARRFLTLIAQLIVNGWFEGTAFELLTTLIPDMDAFDSVAKLPEDLVDALGLGRLARVALRPYAQMLVATPLEWKLNQQHHPTLFSASQAIQLNLRQAMSDNDLQEELTRQGWSAERIASLKLLDAKYTSVDDELTLGRHGERNRQNAIDTLLNQGWDSNAADRIVKAAEYRRIDGIIDNANATLLRAFVDGDVSDNELDGLLQPSIPNDAERNAWVTAATTQKAATFSHLTQAEVTACVKKNILPTAYYREWLELHHYSEEEATALELLLRTEIDEATSVEDHRKQVEAERAAAKAQAEKDKAEKAAKAEAEAELARRGSLTDLRRAAVRGLVPITRLTEILNARYDADFVQTYVDLVEADRQDYLKQQAAAAEAEKRATNRRIDIGALEQAVLTNVLDFGRFHQALLDRGINADDADLLTATLRVRKQDQDDAKAKRAAAEAAAKIKHIDLSTFERLVRRGARSLSDYDALLEQLGFDDASRAAMRELLQLQINDDAVARKAKDDAAAALRNKGVSLENERRAVVLGLQSTDDYERFLRAQGFNTNAVALLLSEVQLDIDAAAAAKAKRDQADAAAQQPAIPFSELRRAARLGVIDVATYEQRLDAAGYSADDIEIELTLLTQEIADVQAARQKQDQADKTVPAGLSLAQLAAAVRTGVKHLEDYRAAAAANPALSADDVTTLVRVLADELASTHAAEARRAALASTVQPKSISIGALDDQVRAGTLSIPAYVGALEAAGLDVVDVDLLVQLLVDELAATR